MKGLKTYMRKVLFLMLFLFLITSSVSAQYTEHKSALSINAVGIDYYSPFDNGETFDSDFFTYGAKLAYHRNLGSDALNLEIPFSLGYAYLADENDGTFGFNLYKNRSGRYGLGALLQLQLFEKSRFIVPYLSGGATASYTSEGGFHVEVPLGVGLDFRIKDDWYFQVRPEYRLGLIDDNRNNYNLNVGFKWFINNNPKPLPPPPVDNDRDKDGIQNKDDKCPDIPGVIGLMGCPDQDGDGVADGDDACPELAGLIDFAGCPDGDGDGLADNNDTCPNEAGPKANNGCPYGDSDGDGINDNEDDCPSIKGVAAFRGCPDSDGDGIADKDDSCPNTPGVAANRGCPQVKDADGDGVIDRDDRCPTTAGPASNNGCPVIKEEVKERLAFAAKNIRFETNSARIKTASNFVMDEVASILLQYPNYNVSIGGHTDSIGNSDFNQRLSEKRAAACLEYLAKKGISKSRMTSKGYGESQPIANNKYEAGRKENRRVEFNLFLK